MTIPADGTKVNFDSSGDDPRAARAEFVDLLDKFNVLLAHLRAAAFVANSYAVGEGVEINAAALRAKVRAAWGIGRDGNGLALDINGMGAFSGDVDPSADFIPVYDAGGSVASKAPPKSVLQSFTYLTELTAVDSAADKMPIFDASAGALKWAKPSALSSGALLHGGTISNGSSAAWQLINGLEAKSARHLFFIGAIYPATDAQTLSVRLLKADGTVLATATTGTTTNTGADIGWRFFGFAPQVLENTNKKLWLSWWGNGGNGQAWGAGGDVSAVDQVQAIASAGNVTGNLQVYYFI